MDFAGVVSAGQLSQSSDLLRQMHKLHSRVDSLACASSTDPTLLACAIARALARLDLTHRVSLTERLRSIIHEHLVAFANDSSNLACWADALDSSGADQTSALRKDSLACHVSLTSVDSSKGGEVWRHILPWAASVDAIAGGLSAVSRGFRHLISEPACWQGHDVTFREEHLSGVVVNGDVGWGRVFALLSTFRCARSLRVAGFASVSSRAKLLPALRNACRTYCPSVAFVSVSFCEELKGDYVDLPTPRKLRVSREAPLRKGGGIVIGNGPLPHRQDGCRMFEVILERLQGERLDIGVTSVAPSQQFSGNYARERHSLAEGLLDSWIIESAGLLVGSHTGLRIRDDRWNARTLRCGDKLGLLVTAVGDIILSINSVHSATWQARILNDVPIYPVLDLFEGSPTVRMLVDEPLT
eukprot:TRINITY_DN74398_c0_g1_i1.p1 TRINITY_DN74398_c0_g1~~TRINITY_DN74398_c0_g1_i1.p1  ORF type:complete len:414 (+),score=27.36 TRINITY_DN74398_c0_g1_i1:120-1361(+)